MSYRDMSQIQSREQQEPSLYHFFHLISKDKTREETLQPHTTYLWISESKVNNQQVNIYDDS